MGKEQNIIIEIDGEEFLLRDDVEIVSSMLYLCNTFTIVTMQLPETILRQKSGKSV